MNKICKFSYLFLVTSGFSFITVFLNTVGENLKVSLALLNL